MYGLGRVPVTLYMEEWTKLLELGDEIGAYETESTLKSKDD